MSLNDLVAIGDVSVFGALDDTGVLGAIHIGDVGVNR